jgi:hypothetical protein
MLAYVMGLMLVRIMLLSRSNQGENLGEEEVNHDSRQHIRVIFEEKGPNVRLGDEEGSGEDRVAEEGCEHFVVLPVTQLREE